MFQTDLDAKKKSKNRSIRLPCNATDLTEVVKSFLTRSIRFPFGQQ